MGKARLYGWDEVDIKPLGPPLEKLFYMDFKYRDILKERREKIEKIKERLS